MIAPSDTEASSHEMDRRITLEQLNTADAGTFVAMLAGLYEHTEWVTARAAALRPFVGAAALLQSLWHCVACASEVEQLALIRAHPELGAHPAASGSGNLTAASLHEQGVAGVRAEGLEDGLREVLARENAAYRARFGFPFVLAVCGADGRGIPPAQILATLRRRLRCTLADEREEALRQINRIAEMRLHRQLGEAAPCGQQILHRCDALAHHSDDEGALTCTYLTPAHRAVALDLLGWMNEAGLSARIDAFGNVIGRYRSEVPGARVLLTGSHYDTVRDAGRYDGRAGVLLAIALLADLCRRGQTLPFHLDIVAFAEEEGVRFGTSFLGSNALTGQLPDTLLTCTDGQGVLLADLLGHMPVADDGPVDAAWLARRRAEAIRPDELVAFLEVHIEQGPVLFTEQMPLGIVTSIAGSKRYLVQLTGQAAHAGTTPMTLRRDALAAAAEIALFVESRCGGVPALVGTVGRVEVPHGAVNVVPGRCMMSIDIRAGDDAIRDSAIADVMARIGEVCVRRGIDAKIETLLETNAVGCAPALQAHFAAALHELGLPARYLPSGAGHDAVALSRITEVGMLFVRCGNGGISHNPLESVTADDLELAARALERVVLRLADEERARQEGLRGL